MHHAPRRGFATATGAWLFGAVSILQLDAQAMGLPVPQLMSALLYLATVAVLIAISRRGRSGSAAPA